MSETKRKIFIVVILILVLLFGVGQFFAGSNLNTASQTAGQSSGQPTSTDTSALPPTQVLAYVPVVPASSTPVQKGSCFANSIAAPYRSDAWRCSVGNAISDPCFVLPSGTPSSSLPQLLCGANPAGTDISGTFVLQLTKKLPVPEIPSSTPSNWAWLVELANGTICSPFTGTRPFSATGEVATYACNGGSNGEGMIFGDLNNAGVTWMAEVGSLSTATSTFPPAVVASATVPIFAVWQ